MGNSFQNTDQRILIQFLFTQNITQRILTLLLILQRLLSSKEILIQFTSLSLSLSLSWSLQAGIGGVCHARYVIQEDRKNSRIFVTKTVDSTNCQEKVEKSVGMAYIYPCPVDMMVCETWKGLPSRWKRWATWAICPIHSVVSLCLSRKKSLPKGPPLSPTSWSSQTAARWSRRLHHSRCIRSHRSVSPLGWLSWKQGRWGAGLLQVRIIASSGGPFYSQLKWGAN